jgi:hypothetical protein
MCSLSLSLCQSLFSPISFLVFESASLNIINCY